MKASLFWSASAAALIASASPAEAQTASDRQDRPNIERSTASDDAAVPQAAGATFGEIVVTARQRNENLQDVPIAVSAFSADELEKRDIKLISELQNYIPNLTINGAFGSTNPQIFIRGVGNNDYNDNAGATVGVYLDGVFLNAPAGKLLQMFDLESAQVLRGPQGTLFGKNNTAGAILFNTRKPGDVLEGYATATGGNYGQVELEGGITLPIASDLSARVSGNWRRSDGWGENRNASDQKVEQIGGINQYALRLVLRWQPTDTDVLLNISHGRTDDERLPGRAIGASPTLTDNNGFKNPTDDIRVNYSNFKELEKVNADGVFLNVTHHFSGIDVSSVTGLWDSGRNVTLDVDKSPNSVIHINRNADARQISQEVRFSSNDDSPIKWVAGANYFREKLNVVNLWGFGQVVPDIPQSYTNVSETFAAFAEGVVKLNDTFSLTLGGRYSIDKRDFDMDFELFGIVNEVRNRKDQQFAGRAILDQKITDDVMLYYSVSRGFQGGGYNGGAFSTAEIGNGYSPETLTAYEFGWKALVADRRLRLNGAIFYYDYQDIQLFSLASTPSGGISQFITNAKGGRLYGLELEAEAIITPEFTIGLGLGLLDSKYEDPTLALIGYDGESFAANGNPFISAPKTDVKAFADYEIPAGDYLVSLHADGSYTSRRNFDITARPGVSGGAYTLVNAKISVGPSDESWNLSIWGKNLFNESYTSFVADLSGSGGFYETFYGAPRQYGLQAKLRF